MTTLRICFVGDSTITGTGDETYRGWPGRLCQAECAKGHDLTLYNLGVRAHTSEQTEARWRSECEARLPETFDCRLVFSFGTNDMADDSETGIRVPKEKSLDIARRMLSDGLAWKPSLFVGPIPCIDDMMPFQAAPGMSYSFSTDRVADLNQAYGELAEKLGIPFLDIFTPLSQSQRWAQAQRDFDGVHPTGDGYQMIADMAAEWPAWRDWMGD